MWCYHENKYRAMRGNRSELAPARKSLRCHALLVTTTSQSFDLFARYYDLDKEQLQADQGLFSQFKTTHADKTTKTAAEVIEVLHENGLLEMTKSSCRVLQGRFYSGRHPCNITLSGALIKSLGTVWT